MQAPSYFNDQFLIAMPGLADPNFFQTVTYICEHNDEGALGIIINRPLQLKLKDLLQHLQLDEISEQLADARVFSGGPVQQEQGFVIHSPIGDWDSTLRVTNKIGITTSRDILAALARDDGPAHALLALGYAGWGAGQLEAEVAENAWLSGPSDERILFETPIEDRWAAAAALLGVDMSLLSGDAGHA